MIRDVRKITMRTPKDAYTHGSAMLSLWDVIRWVFAWTDGGIDSTLQRPRDLSVTSFFMIMGNQPMSLPVGDIEALFGKIQDLTRFIDRCFHRSSRKDQLMDVVRKSIEIGTWYPCLYDLDNWSDWERFAALELLVAVAGIRNNVLDCSFLLLNLTQLTCFQASKGR